MSATARASGSPDGRSGPVRVARGSTHRTGVLRTGTYRTGVVRGGSGRTATPRRQPSRSVPVRAELRLVPPPAPARDRQPRQGSDRRARDRHGHGRSRRLPFVLLVLGLLVGTTLSLLVLNTAIAVDSLKATSLRHQNDHREQELQRLQQEVVNGSTTQKLAGEAAAAGLVPAGTAGYLVVEPDGTSTFRGDPAPATAPPAAPPAQNQTPGPAEDQQPAGPNGTTGGN